MTKELTFTVKERTRILDLLRKKNIETDACCGGNGSCGKCRVKVLDGSFTDAAGRPLEPDANSEIRACRAYAVGKFTVEVKAAESFSETPSFAAPHDFDLALDVGTTTLCFAFTDNNGQVLRELSVLNPQRIYGADVISRISAGPEAHKKMRELLFDIIIKVIGDSRVNRLYVTGNTAMLHIFAGVSPESLGIYPFRPVFTGMPEASGREFGLPCEKILLLPSASAYIGADIVGGIYETGLSNYNGSALLADLGTNGELILASGGRLYGTSAAAGPALEGGEISCGTGGIPGAVCGFENGGYRTIDNAAPIGICGSGLIDIMAQLITTGAVDGSGFMEDSFELRGIHRDNTGKALSLASTGLFLSPGDIRAFQLAKGAISAAIECLIDDGRLSQNSLDCFFIAGGLGRFINHGNAFRTGLFPQALREVRCTAVGNTALASAVSALRDPSVIASLEEISRSIINIELNSLPSFSDRFISNLGFKT